MFKCDLCSQEFKSLKYLNQHLNKKNKCNFVTAFQCVKCCKYFKYKKNMIEHTEKSICQEAGGKIVQYEKNAIVNTTYQDKKVAIRSLLNSTMDENSKIELLKQHNLTLNTEQIKTIISSNMDIEGQVTFLSTLIESERNEKTDKTHIVNNINAGVINTTSNITNNTQNIQINNFGKEDIAYLDNDYFKDLILNNHIEKAYMKLTEDIYLHQDHPENLTVKVDNLNNKYAFVYESGKWKGILKYELKELLHNKNSKLLKVHCKKLKNILDTAKKNSISVFLARDYDGDAHLKDMNEKMVLLFYEPKQT